MSIALRGLAILLLVAAANAACTQLMTEPMCRTKPTFKVAELSSCTLSPLLLPKAWSPGSVYDTPRGKKCCLPTQSSMLCGEVHPFGFELQPTNVVRDFHKVEPKLLKHIEIDDGVLDISTIPLDAQLYVINAHGTAGTDGIPNTAPATKKFLTTLNKAARTANHIKVVIFLSCAVGDSVTRHMEMLTKQGDKDPYTTAMNHFLNPRRGLVCDSTISTSGVFIVHVSPLHPLSGNSKSNWFVQAVQALIGTSSDEVRKMVAHISKLIIDPAGLTNIKIGEFITQFKLTSDIKFSQTNAPVFHYCMMKDLDAILTGIAANAVAPYTDLQFRIMMTPYRIDQ